MTQPFRIIHVGVDHPHGAGWREVLTNLPGEVELTALVPRFGGSLASLEERNVNVPRFETVEQALAGPKFEGAIVTLPNREETAAAITLAKAGKHILVEKPAAASADEARVLADAVKKAGVAFQSGYVWRYDPGANRLRDMIREGRLGKVISVEMAWSTSDIQKRGADHYLFDPALCGGGFFNWMAVHWLDLLFYVTGQAIVGVTARTGQFGTTATTMEDGGAAIFDLEGGGLATFVGGYWHPRWVTEGHWHMRGSQRWVQWEPNRPGTGGEIIIHGPQPQFHAMEETFTLPRDTTPGYGGARSVVLIRDWIAQARGGQACRNTPASMVATLELVDAIMRSSAEGRRLETNIS